MQRYNALLHTVRSSLCALERGIRGLVVMSADLEETFACIHELRVPPSWTRAYPSLKPLGAWTRDLARRVEHFSRWAETARPPVLFWLSAFTQPGGFLAAVLQASARLNGVSMDCLCWEFVVSTVDDNNILAPPKDGVWVRGLYLEGAGWDRRASCLVEAEPMELVCALPTMHFKPAERKRRSARGMYACPCYYCPDRAGSPERPSLVLSVDLRAGSQSPEHWVKRGTALLMSLAN
ncbi:dynein axonemal heavy chain 2-like [Lethenteron reissneri]|uniref:dynein axonemal heavy chain 2-like n=1 Tax=Lethenteron reissneri TaxID=7753 RepID=UPI002AB72032|nr:dynein axonemal heavy chain 2-like [Lethenteron reissneri]